MSTHFVLNKLSRRVAGAIENDTDFASLSAWGRRSKTGLPN